MTDVFGARLLKELKTESLDTLLSSLTAGLPIESNPAASQLPFLRDLLELHSTVQPSRVITDETRPTGDDTILSSPSPPSSPPLQEATESSRHKVTNVRPPIIEISSATTNSSREHLLNYMLAHLLGPERGRPKNTIIYFDCAYKLSILDLQAFLLKVCSQDESLVTDALSRLHIIRPESSRQLLTRLRKVESYIFSLPSKNLVLSAVFLADLSAYYWSERWAEDEARFQSTTATEEKIYSRESLHTMILAEVCRLQKMFRCTAIVSSLGVASGVEGNPSVRSGLAGPWIRAVDIRIVLGQKVDSRIPIMIDAKKWLAACGGRDGKGKASCEAHVHRDGLVFSELIQES